MFVLRTPASALLHSENALTQSFDSIHHRDIMSHRLSFKSAIDSQTNSDCAAHAVHLYRGENTEKWDHD